MCLYRRRCQRESVGGACARAGARARASPATEQPAKATQNAVQHRTLLPRSSISSGTGSRAGSKDSAQNAAKVEAAASLCFSNSAGSSSGSSSAGLRSLTAALAALPEELLGEVGHHDGCQDGQGLADEVTAHANQPRSTGQLRGHLVLLAAKHVTNNFFAVGRVHLAHVHAAVEQVRPGAGQAPIEARRRRREPGRWCACPPAGWAGPLPRRTARWPGRCPAGPPTWLTSIWFRRS